MDIASFDELKQLVEGNQEPGDDANKITHDITTKHWLSIRRHRKLSKATRNQQRRVARRARKSRQATKRRKAKKGV
jgi:hypothetical protein